MEAQISTSEFRINDGLFSEYLKMFNKDGEGFLKAVCNCKVPSDVILEKYKNLVPIENIGEKEKQELWEYAGELFPDKTREEKLNCCRIVYTIGSFL